MNSERKKILSRVRTALVDAPPPPARSIDPPAGDARGRAEMVDVFASRARDYHATVQLIARSGIGRAVESVCSRHRVRRAVVPPGLPSGWCLPGERYAVDRGLTARELDGYDAVVTACRVGIAQTGTLVLDHAPDQGRRAISLVPDLHVCVIDDSQIVWSVPEAFAHFGATSALTWISGPSATADIEFERVEGVHGPRRLEILVVS
jgi:L-lactate dehydrogenase complex protein LldG